MIDDGGIRFLLLNKGHNFSSKTKFPLKYTHDLLKLKLQTWDGDEILLLPLTPKWKYTKSTQQSTLLINLFIAKIIVNIGKAIHRASWCLLGGLFLLWRLYVHYLRTKWNLTQTFLEKKANFNLRVTVVDKRIPFFHYVKRSPATRKTTFIKKEWSTGSEIPGLRWRTKLSC